MPSPVARGPVVVSTLLLLTVVAAPAGKRPKLQPCSVGRFLVSGDRLVAGSMPLDVDVVEIAGRTLSIASSCRAGRTRPRANRKGTTLGVKWTTCPGLKGRVTLKARADPLCMVMTGRLRAKRFLRKFSATRSRCGDGTIDAGNREVCDSGNGCAPGIACDPLSCRCGVAPTRCAAAGGQATMQAPVLLRTLADRYQEAWLGSPAAVDLDGDGVREIIVPPRRTARRLASRRQRRVGRRRAGRRPDLGLAGRRRLHR